ncbi:MAG: SDR family NAD(P)-dependent oxidoreductase, partial [Gemmataceae bacterium]
MSVLDRFRLDGRKAIITAGSRGLGLSMAKALAEAGADLLLVSKTLENLEAARNSLLSTGRNVEIVAADLSQPEVVETTCQMIVEDHGPIDIVINNVGGRLLNVAVVGQLFCQRLV